MSYRVVKKADQAFDAVAGSAGLTVAPLVGAETGSVHMGLSVCTLAPGASTPAQRHAFEESWFVLAGSGTAAVGHLSFATTYGSFGVTPVGAPEQKVAGGEGLTWLRMRAPQAHAADSHHGHAPADEWTPSAVTLTPDETDPRSLWTGQWSEGDMGPRGPISMPGYHGPNIKSIFVRMLVDELLGAYQHTHFMVEFGPKDPDAQYASVHYHPFEEAYYLLAGSAHGILDGEDVDVAAGDTVWTGVGATHGFYTTSDEPLRWLEVQTPTPPPQNAFYFPKDWQSLQA